MQVLAVETEWAQEMQLNALEKIDLSKAHLDEAVTEDWPLDAD